MKMPYIARAELYKHIAQVVNGLHPNTEALNSWDAIISDYYNLIKKYDEIFSRCVDYGYKVIEMRKIIKAQEEYITRLERDVDLLSGVFQVAAENTSRMDQMLTNSQAALDANAKGIR